MCSLRVAGVSGFLHLRHFIHHLWKGVRWAAITTSAGYIGVRHAGHCGDAGANAHFDLGGGTQDESGGAINWDIGMFLGQCPCITRSINI